ncbi:MAG: AraC family transcriptional regulator [Verrucomicrobiota bacterium]
MPPNPTPPPDGSVVNRPKVIPLQDFGISVFESRHAPGFVGKLRDDFSKFLLVLAGQAIWEANGTRILLEADSFVHVPAGVEHHQVDIEGNAVTLYALHYSPTLLRPELNSRLAASGLYHWNATDATRSLTRFLRCSFQEMLYEQHLKREGWETVLCARLLEMAARSVRLLSRRGDESAAAQPTNWDAAERVAQYVRQLQTRFYKQETLDEAARSVGLSRRLFTNMFRETAGQSWLEYRLQLRLKHTLNLLTQSDNSIIAIAFEAGFEDLSNFHRAFKQTYGCTPKAHRDRLKAPATGTTA